MNLASTKDYIAILDIGSNAVRLVIYDGLNRAPVKLYNERDICGLGADLPVTGKLNPDGKRRARASIARFCGLIAAMKIGRTEAVATAALRNAADGEKFAAGLERDFGLKLRIVDGDEEARLAALGVMMNGLGGHGMIGDLGGGSLELIDVRGGKLHDKCSMNIGTHYLQTLRSRTERIDMIDAALDTAQGLIDNFGTQGDFYALGGSWRSMATAHMRMKNHPIRVLDQYAIDGKTARDYAALLSQQSVSSLERTEGLSKKRAHDVAVASLVMERVFARLKPKRLVFSGTGLREGVIFDQLTAAQKRQDGLIASCRKMALHLGRFDDVRGYTALMRWMAPLFVDEPASFTRMLEANCLLSDTVWAEHEDYRAEQAFERLLASQLYGIDHMGRAFLAVSQYVRYAGRVPDTAAVDPRAVVAGRAMRVAYMLTGGALGLLGDSDIRITPKKLTLNLRGKCAALHAPVIEDVFAELAVTVGRAPVVKIFKDAAVRPA